MATFTPATDVWTPLYSQSGTKYWQNGRTKELRLTPPGQGVALPPRALRPSPMDDPQFNTPAPVPRPGEALPMPVDIANGPLPNLPNGSPFPPMPVDFANSTPRSIPNVSPFSPPTAPLPLWPPYPVGWPGPQPEPPQSPPSSRAEEAKQWTRMSDNRGEYYYNHVTRVSQSDKPDCMKKYTSLW